MKMDCPDRTLSDITPDVVSSLAPQHSNRSGDRNEQSASAKDEGNFRQTIGVIPGPEAHKKPITSK